MVASEPPAARPHRLHESSAMLRQSHAAVNRQKPSRSSARQPNSIETRPLAMFEIIIGIMNGEIQLKPLVMRIVC